MSYSVDSYKQGENFQYDKLIYEFIVQNRNSTIFHEPNFNRIVSNHFHTKFIFLIYSKNKIINGICPLHQIENRFYSALRHYDVVYGGWLFLDKKDYSIAHKLIPIKSFQALKEYWSFPDIFNDLSQLKFKIKTKTAFVELEKELDLIFQNDIQSKRRNMIKKALKNDLIIDSGGEELMPRFYNLLSYTYYKASLKMRPLEYYTDILKHYYPKNQAICMIAKKNNQDLSGILLLRNKNFSQYWLGATNEINFNLGSSELLQWEAIKWSKKKGSTYYDLCVVDPEKLLNISRFKLGFSKTLVPFYFTNNKPILFRIINKLKKSK